MKFSIKDFFETADLATLFEEIVNGNKNTAKCFKKIKNWVFQNIVASKVLSFYRSY